ncbi:MAG: hypothetical protein U0359_37825, partial [Byssovorax sp.]
MLKAYREHVAQRAAQGIVPLPLDARQVAELVELFAAPPPGEEAFLLDLLSNRVPAGVDGAARVKAEYLTKVAKGEVRTPLLDRVKATELLGTMLGGFNVDPLIALLDDADLAPVAAAQLKKTMLVFAAFDDVEQKAKAGNKNAAAVLDSWAKAEWFLTRPEVPADITVTVFKVVGETNTDDLSP